MPSSDAARNLHVTLGSNEVAAAGSPVVVMATVLTAPPPTQDHLLAKGGGEELGLGPGVGDNCKGPWGTSGCEASNTSTANSASSSGARHASRGFRFVAGSVAMTTL